MSDMQWLAVLLVSCLGCLALGYITGNHDGKKWGRDAQWVDDFIAACQREAAKRDRLGRFKSKTSP